MGDGIAAGAGWTGREICAILDTVGVRGPVVVAGRHAPYAAVGPPGTCGRAEWARSGWFVPPVKRSAEEGREAPDPAIRLER
jgi:hypothetical protein